MSTSTISTESDLEPREVSTDPELTNSDDALPEIVIRQVLTIDEIIKDRGFINIFEENFIGYLQGLLKNRSKAEIFNGLYERYRVAQNLERPEEECYIPILANIRDTVEERQSQLPEEDHVDMPDADEFTRLYINYRRKLAQAPAKLDDYLRNPFALALLNAGAGTEYTQPTTRESQEVCVNNNIDDVMVLRHEKGGIELRRVGTAYREPATTENMNLADRQWRATAEIVAQAPSFEDTLGEITPEMDIHEIMVLLEKRGFPLFYLTSDQFGELKDRLNSIELTPEPIPDYGAAGTASTGSLTHEQRIKEYWDILRRAVDSVSSRIRNRPTLDAPEEWPQLPIIDLDTDNPEAIIQAFKTYRAETYKKIIHDIYQDFRDTTVNVERTSSKIAWDRYIEPWIKYVYSYEFQFMKLYNELEEIRVAEDTKNYLGSIYDIDGIVADISGAEAVDAVDDDIGDEDPFRELEYPDPDEPRDAREPQEPGEPHEDGPGLLPVEDTDPALKVNLFSEDLYRPGTLANEIIDKVKTFLQYWIYQSGLMRYFDPQILKAALRDFYNKDSRVQRLQAKLGDKYNYANYFATNVLERPAGIAENSAEWKNALKYVVEVEDYVTESCEAYLVDVAYRWTNRMLDMITERVIFPEISISATQRTYWNPYGYPIKKEDLAVALLKPGLLKYLSITAEQVSKQPSPFYKFFRRSIKSVQTLEEAAATDKDYYKYFSKFEYRLFSLEYKARDIDESKKVNPYLSRCNGDKLGMLYIKQMRDNTANILYNKELPADIAAEYVKIYKCLSAGVMRQMNADKDKNEELYNNYMMKFYHKGHMILKIGANFIPDLDWISRVRINDSYAQFLLLIKNKIKFNRFAYIPKYSLALYPAAAASNEVTEPTPVAKIAPKPVEDLEESPAPSAVDVDIHIERLYNYYKNKNPEASSLWEYNSNTTNYTYFRTLSKRLMKKAYKIKTEFPPTHNFHKNLDTLIRMHKESPVSANAYRDICILTIYVNDWNNNNPHKKLLKASIKYYNEWLKIPNTYIQVNTIITQQREKNKNDQLEEYNKMGQEKANLQKELIMVGFKK